MAKNYILGLDIGTTSVKVVVFHLNGKVAAEHEELITSYFPEQGWVEQDPEEIFQATLIAIKEGINKSGVSSSGLVGIGFSSAMHSLICADENGQPLSRAIIWSDGRSSEQAERIKKSEGEAIYAKTGTPIHPMSPFVKLLWMKETDYEPYKKAAYFFSIKEYILYKWYGKRVIDYGMASATGLFNGTTLQWEASALDIVQVDANKLSKPVPPTELLRGIQEEYAQQMGISAELPLSVGSADGQLANLGIGAILPGEVVVTVGTSGAVRQWTGGFQTDTQQETFSYRFSEATSIVGGPTNNGGIALEWLKGVLNDQGPYDEFTATAEKAPIGSEGMVFLPYVNGERAPLWNQKAKGTFFGMTIGHQKEHFVRAVLEGISFNLYQINQALERLAGETEKIYVNGGLARSPLWLQMMADIFGKPIYVPESHHSAAWGAAWTALVAMGEVSSFEEIKKNIPMQGSVMPNEENHRLYQEVYEKYARLAKDLSVYYK
ncbi:gluconokinase [Bacillus sp. B15-48]|uniref:gluconokinase n=1 Tax=Bacillus sp. B15-48 TaxID=1548601 RepID=UPI00193F295C|nr:gluconokinase [Bacillus sp. B15-48]MBM4764669.1 gluconate kinase [Bacillus sp. B15-48]